VLHDTLTHWRFTFLTPCVTWYLGLLEICLSDSMWYVGLLEICLSDSLWYFGLLEIYLCDSLFYMIHWPVGDMPFWLPMLHDTSIYWRYVFLIPCDTSAYWRFAFPTPYVTWYLDLLEICLFNSLRYLGLLETCLSDSLLMWYLDFINTYYLTYHACLRAQL